MVGVEHIDPSCLSLLQASRILRALADRIDKEALPEPLPVVEAQAGLPAKIEVKKERSRAIHLKPISAEELCPCGCKGEKLEAFSVVSDIQGMDAELVGRSPSGEWYMRQETNGKYLWFKFTRDSFPRLLEAAYSLDKLEEAEVD
jgi:hypothetical protein